MEYPGDSAFSTWNNNFRDGNKRFTSVYSCPLTGERFASGIISSGTCETDFMYYFSDLKQLKFKQMFDEDVEDNIKIYKVYFVWYKSKKEAENAAAARAIDCFRCVP